MIGVFSAIKLFVSSLMGDPYENRFADFSKGANFFVSILAVGFVSTEFLALFGFLGMFIIIVPSQLAEIDVIDFMMDGLGAIMVSSVVLFGGHALSFFANFIARGEYKTARAIDLIILPFSRCKALLASIVIAYGVMFLIPALATTTGFAVLLILLKIFWDYRAHTRERDVLANRPANAKMP